MEEITMIQRGTEFLPTYIQMLIKYSGGYGFESWKKQLWDQDFNKKMEDRIWMIQI